MDYQLVIQILGSGNMDYDLLICLENKIRELVNGYAIVDGHDCGSGESNVFLLTDDPLAAFHRLQSTMESIPGARVAYRVIGEDEFTILYPVSLTDFTVN